MGLYAHVVSFKCISQKFSFSTKIRKLMIIFQFIYFIFSEKSNKMKSKNFVCKDKVNKSNTIIIKKQQKSCCESTKHKRFYCRQLDLWKVCNYILISCLVLVSLVNGTDSILGGCSSNPCVFGVCIDEING